MSLQMVAFEGRGAIAFWLQYFIEEVVFKRYTKETVPKNEVRERLQITIANLRYGIGVKWTDELAELIGSVLYEYALESENLPEGGIPACLKTDPSSETHHGIFLRWQSKTSDDPTFFEIRILSGGDLPDSLVGVQILLCVGENVPHFPYVPTIFNPDYWAPILQQWALL